MKTSPTHITGSFQSAAKLVLVGSNATLPVAAPRRICGRMVRIQSRARSGLNVLILCLAICCGLESRAADPFAPPQKVAGTAKLSDTCKPTCRGS